jgi:hypothetical protein
VPDDLGGGELRVRFDRTDEDRRTEFSRTEHLRPFPPSDADNKRLYPRRADAESINRALDDSMWLGRAHSAGAKRQLVDLLGFAMMVNSLALHAAASPSRRRTSAPRRPPSALAAPKGPRRRAPRSRRTVKITRRWPRPAVGSQMGPVESAEQGR